MYNANRLQGALAGGDPVNGRDPTGLGIFDEENEIYAKLANPKTRGPWVEVRPTEAQDIANEGGFAFGVQRNNRRKKNGELRPGHIARVIPETRASRERVDASETGTRTRTVGAPVIGNVGAVNRDRPASHAFTQPPSSTKVRFFTEVSTGAAVRLKKRAEFPELDFEIKDDRNFLEVAWDYYTGR
jgi:hypothetical protein